jgi:hypothetical protein
VGIVAQKIKEEIDRFIQLVTEHRKDFRQNALLYTPAGDDSVPLNEERLILVKVDGTGRYVAVGTLTPSQGAKPGEKILFGRDPDGKVTGKLSFLNDGTVKLENEKDEIHDTKGARSETIGGDKTENIKGKKTETIEGDKTESIKGKFYIGNSMQNECKLWLDFIDLIEMAETFGPPPKHTLMPTFIQQLEQFKNVVKSLYKESE